MGIIGTAELLSWHYKVLQNIATKGIQKSLEPFIDKGLNSATQTVKVIAQNSHHKGREIKVYDSFFIESLIRAYAFALASDKLRKAQYHIGKRCVFFNGFPCTNCP